MKQYFLGVDVGATKTHALIADQEGMIVGVGWSGPGNHETVDYCGLQKALTEAVDQALRMAKLEKEMIAGSGFGVAGYDWPSEREPTLQTIQNLGLKSKVEVVNDAILGLLAGTPQGWGIAVVSGTGCNCRGWDKTHQHEGRVIGRSMLAGEGAGGTELITEAMKAVSYEWIKRGPHTEISNALLKYTGAKNLADLLEGYYEGYYDLNSNIAPLIFQVANEGDEIAIDIIRWAGCELGELINAVIRQLQFEEIDFDIVLVGSMFEGGELLQEPMRRKVQSLASKAKFLRLTVPPTIGAVLLGMESAGYKYSPSVRDNLVGLKMRA